MYTYGATIDTVNAIDHELTIGVNDSDGGCEFGPTCTPLEMRSLGMDTSSRKHSLASIRLSSVMAAVKSALV